MKVRDRHLNLPGGAPHLRTNAAATPNLSLKWDAYRQAGSRPLAPR